MNAITIAPRHVRGARALLRAAALLGASVPALIVPVTSAVAQDYTNVTASGRVQGTDGKPVASATVEIMSSDRGFTRSATTDVSGSYKFPQLAPGTYTVTVSAAGYDSYTEQQVVLSQAGASNQFTLVPTASGGEIVVTAGRRQVPDFERTTTGGAINIGELDKRVPVARSLRDIILLSPGTVQGSSANNGGFAGQASISGSSFTENAYYVNGLNITDFRLGFSPVTVPYDFLQTVEVKTGGFPAEFGRATGGFVNAITKSGSNTFHGSVLFNWQPSGLTSSARNTFNADNDGDKRSATDSVFQLSGPIIKDHLFFYAMYDARNAETIDGTATAATPGGNTASIVSSDAPFWGGKLDAVIVDGQHLEFTYFDTTSITRTQTFAYNSATDQRSAFLGGNNQRTGGANWVARYTGNFAPWITVSAAYGINRKRDGTLPLDTTHEMVTDYRSGVQGTSIGLNSVDSVSFNDDKRRFYRGDVDLYFRALGSHHVRFGVDHEDLTAVQTYQTIGTGNLKYYRVTDPATDITGLPIGTEYVVARNYRNSGAFKGVNQAFYIEDSWGLLEDRLTLQLGLRDDKFDNRDANGKSFYKTKDLFAPRLGFTFDPTGDSRTKIYGSFGRYYLPLNVNMNLSFAGSVLTFNRYNVLNGVNAGDGTPILGAPISTVAGTVACPDTKTLNCTVARDGSVSDTTNTFAHNLRPQSQQEFILGAERRLGSKMRAGFYFTHRELKNTLEDSSIDLAARAYCVGQGFTAAACTGIYGGGSQFVIINPGRDNDVTLIGLPDGSKPTVHFTAAQLGYPKPVRHFNSATATFDRDFDGVWSLSGSYTWSKTVGNYEGGAASDTGQVASGQTAAFDSPGLVDGTYGELPNSRRHTLKMFGSYRATEWLDIGTNLLIQSPKRYGCIGVVPTAVDAYAHGYGGYGFYCQGVLVPRGSAFKSDWRKQIDLSLQLRLPAKFDASIRLDIFNLFNFKSALDFDEHGDFSNGQAEPTYGKVMGYQDPRSVRMQLRIGF